MTTTFWENAHKTYPLIIMGDIKPWGGYSVCDILENVRAQNITINMGANFDSATLIYNDKVFGEEQPYFKPIRILTIEGEGLEAKQSVLFRGFIVQNKGTIDSGQETMQIMCHDYKWLMTRRTIIRGQWYAVDGASSAPSSIGSGLSIGSTKLTYEKFRARPQNDGGYLQNQPCVFNKNGRPDCFTNSYASSMCIFYVPEISWQEENGLRDNYWENLTWAGHYWTWATILSHIQQYWIEPYNASLTNIRIHRNDLSKIARLDDSISKPIDFSLENMNPVNALDNVVRNLPGRWFWYLDYSQPTVKIRIKEFDPKRPANDIYLRICDAGNKIAESNANVERCSVTRDGADASKYAIAKGGKLKIITTVKLVPLWKKFGAKKDQDFENGSDYNNWLEYISKRSGRARNVDKVDERLDEATKLRYDRIYRYYGIPLEGELLGNQIVSKQRLTEDTVQLEGTIGREYSVYERDIRELFFQTGWLHREISAPNFAKYTDQVAVFMWDDYHDLIVRDKTGGTVGVRDRFSSGNGIMTATEKIQARNRAQWIIPSKDKLGYQLDEKNAMIVFDKPQFMREASASGDEDEMIVASSRKFTHNGAVRGDQATKKMQSREVYLTATFSLDAPALLGRKISSGLVDYYGGAPFTVYLNRAGLDVVVHHNAWYPIEDTAKEEEEVEYSDRTLNSHIVGKSVRRCDKGFANYKEYVGYGAQELYRGLMSYIEGYSRLKETVEASIPYLENGYQLGDRLKKIHGTEYTDLNCMLTRVTWQAVADSDAFDTVLSLTNYYAKDKQNQNRIQAPDQREEKDQNIRERFTYTKNLDEVLG